MTCPRSVKTAAVVSQSLLVLWITLQLLLGLFQKQVVLRFTNMSESDFERVGKVVLWAVFALCAADILIMAANLLMCMGKCKIAPLAVSSVTVGLLPFAVSYLIGTQNQHAAAEGIDKIAVLGVYGSVVNLLSRILYAGAIVTIAAAAVYAYAMKNQNAENNIPAEIKKENDLL